ncbi:MAG: glutamine-hydrolyzing GMP synthase [bacterium]|nr:glutamine-hydrolyzing GMP synthase [bacterium]
MKEVVVVLDFGSQYTNLIARRIREQQVYSEILPCDVTFEEIEKKNPKGIILSGGPSSVYEEGAPTCSSLVFSGKYPVLGICYGMQLMAYVLGGKVVRGERGEFGKTLLKIENESLLFDGIDREFISWMSHNDIVIKPPGNFKITASTDNTPIAAMEDSSRNLYAVQFHPEVVHTINGDKIIRNFLYKICRCSGDWTPEHFINETIENIKRTVKDGRVICALSGGVDSTTTAVLVHKAIGDNLICIFVNQGTLRQNEVEQVLDTLRNFNMKVEYIDATERFLERLKGVIDPEEKRKIIGHEFVSIFEEIAIRLGNIDFLAQGTLYPDVIESATSSQKAHKIKTHHNVGGLPEKMRLRLIEPLRYLFKDEVRKVALSLGIPERIVYRQPFPGPGLAIRIIGEVTKERLEIIRKADYIISTEIERAGLSKELWQYFGVLLPEMSVGVMGDKRTFGHVVAIRAILSEDGMTADWARLPYSLLETISNRIINEVPKVNRVVYDISSKPPATIEWE